MIKVKIYGLVPKSKSRQSVVLYNKNCSSSSTAVVLSKGVPDENGVYSCTIPKKLIEDKIIASVIFHESEHLEIRENLTIDTLGIYHAVKLEKETNLNSSRKTWPINCESSWYSNAVNEAIKSYRSARYKNWTLTILSAIAAVIGVGGGLVFDSNTSIYLGGFCALFCVASAKYASG